MKVGLMGGTGFVGASLLNQLVAKGYKIVLLTRDKKKAIHLESQTIQVVQWQADDLDSWKESIEGCDAIINLAGEGIAAKRWTKQQKEKIKTSRIQSTRSLVRVIESLKQKPPVLVNASAIGYYGDVPEGDVTESHPKGESYLSDVCEGWEKEAEKAQDFGVRVVMLRIGIVLGKKGGALKRMLPPFQFFIGGPLGTGKQWFPWVHRDDVIGAILFSLTNEKVEGRVNMTAPESLRMKEFCHVLGKVLHRPSSLPVPTFALKLLAGDMSEMLITGQKVVPKKLQEYGYTFKYPQCEEALRAIL